MCKYIMWLIIFPYVDHGIRYEWRKMTMWRYVLRMCYRYCASRVPIEAL